MATPLRYVGPIKSAYENIGRKAIGIKPGDALHRWRRAYAARAIRPINVLCLGDSVTIGGGATNWQYTYPNVLQQLLNESTGHNRLDADYEYAQGGYHVRAALPGDFSTLWTKVGSPVIVSRGSGLNAMSIPTGTSITYRAKSCDGFLWWWEDGSGAGQPNVKITSERGVPAVDSNMTMNTGLPQYTRTALGAVVPRGGWDITFSRVTGTPVIDGIYVLDGDVNSGVRVYNWGWGGMTSADFIGSGTAAVSSRNALGSSGAIKPDVMVILIGANDYGIGINPATFQTNVTQIISEHRTAFGWNAPVLLVSYYPRYDVPTPTYAWSQYREALRAISLAVSDVEFLDLEKFFATTQTADDADGNMIDTSGVHPTPNGYSYLARAIADRLMVPFTF